jgi:TPP-dependent 2-oxoacid decarboxylase
LGQKNNDTLALNQSSDVAQKFFTLKLFQALQSFLDNVHSTRINHRAQAYIKQTNKHTKNKAPIKREALKERIKG